MSTEHKKGSHVLITGATGFVAAWCCKHALDQGCKVTGTVRSPAKGEFLKKLFNGKPFDYVIVEDQSQLGSYDHVFKNSPNAFDGVLHTSSPVSMDADDPNELIIPAVNGVKSLVQAVHAYAPSVKRVVMTSSDAAIRIHSAKPPKTFDENSWDTESVDICKRLGKKAPGPAKYRASKIMAEKAFWTFGTENNVSFEQAVVNPTLVGGPPLHQITSEDSINFSIKVFYDYIYNHTPDKTHITDNVDNYVDVRSIAELHWLALTKAEGCGRRFIGSIGPVCMQDVSVVLNKHDSSLKLPKGKPGGEKEADSPENAIVVDGGRAVRLLGLRHISLKQSLIDMYEEFESRRADWGIKDSLSATRDLPFTAPRSLYEVPQVAFEANGPVDRTADKGCWANLSSTIGEVASSFRYCLFGQDIKLEDIDQEEAMGEKQAFAII